MLSDWIAIDFTVLLAPVPVFVLNTMFRVPSEFRRTMRFAVAPLKVVKSPPKMIFPSDWIASALTELFAPVPVFVEKVVSRVPSELSLIIRFLADPLNVKKAPPKIILPSDWIAIADTALFGPEPMFVVNVVSRVPSEFRRTIRFTVTPLKVVKPPPKMILPSDWIAILFT